MIGQLLCLLACLLALLALFAVLALLACCLCWLACLLPVGMVLARWLPLGCHWELHGMPLGSISVAWDGLGPHFGGLGDILGMAWLLSWPGDSRMAWIAFRPKREHCFTGIQGTAKV